MSIGLFGNKIGMTQVFSEDGSATPVTVIRVGPCLIIQVKTKLTDGYDAVQIGYSQVPLRKLTKPQLGHLKKAGAPPLKYLGEYNPKKIENFQVGQKLTVDQFNVGQLVNISGSSIGKGFSGNPKRHNFKRGPMTHGSKKPSCTRFNWTRINTWPCVSRKKNARTTWSKTNHGFQIRNLRYRYSPKFINCER